MNARLPLTASMIWVGPAAAIVSGGVCPWLASKCSPPQTKPLIDRSSRASSRSRPGQQRALRSLLRGECPFSLGAPLRNDKNQPDLNINAQLLSCQVRPIYPRGVPVECPLPLEPIVVRTCRSCNENGV